MVTEAAVRLEVHTELSNSKKAILNNGLLVLERTAKINLHQLFVKQGLIYFFEVHIAR